MLFIQNICNYQIHSSFITKIVCIPGNTFLDVKYLKEIIAVNKKLSLLHVKCKPAKFGGNEFSTIRWMNQLKQIFHKINILFCVNYCYV